MALLVAPLSLDCHQNEYIFITKLRQLSGLEFIGFSGFSEFQFHAQKRSLL